MLQRGLALIAGALLLWFVAQRLILALASDETRIRLALSEGCTAYGEARARPIMELLSPAWRDPSGATRDDVLAWLGAQFLTERDRATGLFPRIATIPAESLTVTVEEATGSARAEFELLLLGRRDEALVWRVHVQSDWREEDGAWVVTGADWRTLEGRQP